MTVTLKKRGDKL